MEGSLVDKELHKIVQIVMLVTMTVFSLVVLIINRLMHWELWMLPVIIGGTVFCWMLHILHISTLKSRIYASAVFLMLETFYYTVNIDTLPDSGMVLIIMILLFAFTGEKRIFLSGVITGITGMVFNIIGYVKTPGFNPEPSKIALTVLQFLLFLLAAALVFQIVIIVSRRENTIKNALNESMEENRQLYIFFARLFHETSGPLNTIKELSSGSEDKSAQIKRACFKLSSQMKEVLDLSGIVLNNLSLKSKPYSMIHLLDNLTDQLSLSDNYGLELVVDLDPSLPAGLIGDKERILKILWHLVINGFKFTEEGGVCIRIYPVKRIYGINLIIEVFDTGCGISEEDMEQIFDKFHHTHPGIAGSVGGLGLGIPIVTGLVENMGGTITINSTPNEGTSVLISIPQKISDSEHCVILKHPDRISAAGFIGFRTTKNPGVRDFYTHSMKHFSNGLSIPFTRVQTRRDLETLLKKTDITHLMIDTGEYLDNKEYIDDLSSHIHVVLIRNIALNEEPGENITVLDKPFYSSHLAKFLNETALPVSRTTGLDISKGMTYCQNDREFYYQLLAEYASDNVNKVIELNNAYAGKDWKLYTIKVHAIKSTSKMIGALPLSSMAQKLEAAAKDGNEDFISQMHDSFISTYDSLMKDILTIDGVSVSSEKKDPVENSHADTDEALEFFPEEILEFFPEGGDDA